MSDPYWTKERCAEVASECATRTEFNKRSQSAYTIAWRNGWLDEICSHMPKRVKRAYKWSDKRIREVVGKYTDFTTFRRENAGLYGVLHQRGAIEKFTAHLDRDRRENGYWTKERCKEAAEQCATRSEFIKRFAAAADASYREGWIEEVCASIPRQGDHKTRCIYLIKATGQKTIYVGLSATPRRRYASHLRHPMRHLRKMLCGRHRFKVVSPFIPIDAAAKLERDLIQHFTSKGWEVLNRNEGGSSGGMPKKWTHKALTDLVATLDTRGQMMREHVGAYCAAHDAGMLDQLFANHPNRGYGDGPIRDWTDDRIRQAAASYSTRVDFKKAEPKAWAAAQRRGFLSKLFVDRPNGGIKRKPNWTDDEIVAAASHFSTPAEFRSGNRRAHKAAERRGMLPTLFSPQKGKS